MTKQILLISNCEINKTKQLLSYDTYYNIKHIEKINVDDLSHFKNKNINFYTMVHLQKMLIT